MFRIKESHVPEDRPSSSTTDQPCTGGILEQREKSLSVGPRRGFLQLRRAFGSRQSSAGLNGVCGASTGLPAASSRLGGDSKLFLSLSLSLSLSIQNQPDGNALALSLSLSHSMGVGFWV